MAAENKGVGKCGEDHIGSFGYPTRPEEPYPFCPQCGGRMVWWCGECNRALPEDTSELATARFCRQCGADYFTNLAGRAAPESADEDGPRQRLRVIGQ